MVRGEMGALLGSREYNQTGRKKNQSIQVGSSNMKDQGFINRGSAATMLGPHLATAEQCAWPTQNFLLGKAAS